MLTSNMNDKEINYYQQKRAASHQQINMTKKKI